DCAMVIDSSEFLRRRDTSLSAIRITMPPTNNAAVTALGVKRRSLMAWRARKPTTNAGSVANPRRKMPAEPVKVLEDWVNDAAVGKSAENLRQKSKTTEKNAHRW